MSDTLSRFSNDEILITTSNSLYNPRSAASNKLADDNDDDWDDEPFKPEPLVPDDAFYGIKSVDNLEPDTREIYKWKPHFSSKMFQVRVLNF